MAVQMVRAAVVTRPAHRKDALRRACRPIHGAFGISSAWGGAGVWKGKDR
jgi:hypothetical protein